MARMNPEEMLMPSTIWNCCVSFLDFNFNHRILEESWHSKYDATCELIIRWEERSMFAGKPKNEGLSSSGKVLISST